MAATFPPLEDRPIKNTICLFDVDGTLTPARQVSRTGHSFSTKAQNLLVFKSISITNKYHLNRLSLVTC